MKLSLLPEGLGFSVLRSDGDSNQQWLDVKQSIDAIRGHFQEVRLNRKESEICFRMSEQSDALQQLQEAFDKLIDRFEGETILPEMEEIASVKAALVASIARANEAKAHLVISEQPDKKFESYEHRSIGNQVFNEFMTKHTDLRNLLRDHGFLKVMDCGGDLFVYEIKVSEVPLWLQPGELIALGGDFYGIANASISAGIGETPRQTETIREGRFNAAFNKLADTQENTPDMIKLKAIREEISKEMREVKKGVLKGKSTVEAHEKYANTSNRHYHAATQHCFFKPFSSEYADLAFDNQDHFKSGARKAYRAGNESAINEVSGKWPEEGANAENQERMYTALRAFIRGLAKELFAFHYYTDLFSAGHIRTPRQRIFAYVQNYPGLCNRMADMVGVSTERCAQILAGYFAKAMHDEDNKKGVFVKRENPARHWLAYGDGHYFEGHNTDNRIKIAEALHASLEQLRNCFYNAEHAQNARRAHTGFWPKQDKEANNAAGQYPLFRTIEGRLELRRNITDSSINDYITNWCPFALLAQLLLVPRTKAVLSIPGDAINKMKGLFLDRNQGINSETEENIALVNTLSLIQALNAEYLGAVEMAHAAQATAPGMGGVQ